MPGSTQIVALDEKRLDAIFAELNQCHLPGAAVGIAVDGKPVYRKGFGLACMELPVLLSPSIRMRIYSTTKHFTCLAYALLCEDGRAGIDDPIGEFLPELNPVTHAVTMRQLMGNLGGLRDAQDICFQFSGTGSPVSSAELLSLYRDIDDVNFPPGTTWCYSNGGFLLLTCAIERITSQPLGEVLRGRIFEPVGMHDTLLRPFDTDFLPNSATMHTNTPAGSFEKLYMRAEWGGEAGMVSTVDDMLRWLTHMNDPWVGSAATWELMKAQQTLVNGISTGYGLGLMIGRYRGVETLYHAGGAYGANSQMLKVPAAGLDITVMVNRGDVSAQQLVNKVLDACLPGLDPVEESGKGPLATGVFRSPNTGRVIQLRVSSGDQCWKAGQHIALIDGLDMAVRPDGDRVLRPTEIDHLKFALTLSGDAVSPTSITLSDFGNLDDLLRVESVAQAAVGVITGRYRSDVTGTEATIADTDDGLRLKTVGRFGLAEFQLERLAEGIWRSRTTSPIAWGGTLVFNGDGSAFHFTSLVTRALPFVRCADSDGSAS